MAPIGTDTTQSTDIVRVATWNLERCPSSRRGRAVAQQRSFEFVDADVWVLTETFVDRAPGLDDAGVFSPSHPVRHDGPDERFVGIWPRWPDTQLTEPAAHRLGSVAAVVAAPIGGIVVYGNVIVYGSEKHIDDGRAARPWEVHAEEFDRQSTEWSALHERYPHTPMIVAGDFNQAHRALRRSYRTNKLRAVMTERLHAAELRSLTDVDLIAAGHIRDRSHVEHTCVTPELGAASDLLAWDRRNESGRLLSDHPTLAIDLRLSLGRRE